MVADLGAPLWSLPSPMFACWWPFNWDSGPHISSLPCADVITNFELMWLLPTQREGRADKDCKSADLGCAVRGQRETMIFSTYPGCFF